MIELNYASKVYQLPENYNELTGKQLIAINEILISDVEHKDVLRIQLLKVLLNLSAREFFKLPIDFKYRALFFDTSTEELEQPEKSTIDWVFTRNGLTDQLLFEYEGLYGPKKEFDNLTVKEFHVCEMAYADYVQNEDADAVHTIAAVLYRACKEGYDFIKDSEGDMRIPFNEHELAFSKSITSKWPVEVLVSIFQFYDGCREYLKELYEDVFSGAGDGNSEPNENNGMFEVIRALSGERYGTFKEVEQMLIHDVMKELELSIKEIEKINQPTTN